ncbi:hypothetical protein ACOSQ3_011852 [Xanthoceras sorbifolium]
MESKDCSLLGISTVDISWAPPQDGWIKLNIDGNRYAATGSITAGGVFKNARADWILGFVANKGASSALEVEIWGILEGLQRASSKSV